MAAAHSIHIIFGISHQHTQPFFFFFFFLLKQLLGLLHIKLAVLNLPRALPSLLWPMSTEVGPTDKHTQCCNFSLHRVCVSVHALSFFFLLKSHCSESFSLSLSLSLRLSCNMSAHPHLSVILGTHSGWCQTSWNQIEAIYEGIVRHLFFLFLSFCSCSGYTHCRTKERLRITHKYVFKDLLTPRTERLLR